MQFDKCKMATTQFNVKIRRRNDRVSLPGQNYFAFRDFVIRPLDFCCLETYPFRSRPQKTSNPSQNTQNLEFHCDAP